MDAGKNTAQAEKHKGRGNTRTLPRRRGFMLTSFEQNVPRELCEKPKMQYIISCDDATKDGKWHCHLFVYFVHPQSFKAVKKLFGDKIHIEIPKMNSDCIDYIKGNIDRQKGKECRKTNIMEYGKQPSDNGKHYTVQQLSELSDPSSLDYRAYNTWEKIHTKMANDIDIDDWHKEVEVYYIQGPSGSGKTEKAKEIVRSMDEHKVNVVKHVNGFWQGVGTAKIAIYDDFRDSHMSASEFINFIDYNIHNMNVKGGNEKNKFTTIIITSVQPLSDIYKNMKEEPRKQWMRRIKPIFVTYPDQIDLGE